MLKVEIVLFVFLLVVSLAWAIRIKLIGLYFRLARLKIKRKYELSEYKLKINGVKWSFLRGGTGFPIILLPGLGANKYQWGAKLYELVKDADLIAIDLPSAGESEFFRSKDFDPNAQVELLGKLISHLKLQNITIIGASIGGLIAGKLALKFPEAIDRTILISPAGLSGLKISDALNRFLETGIHPFGYETVEEMDALYEILFKSPPKIPYPLKKYLALKNKKEIKRRLLAIHAVKPYILNGLNEFMANYRGRLLLIWGTFDMLFDASIAKEVAEQRLDLTVSMIESGHLPYLESPEYTYDLIHTFINKKFFID